jgi:hypothetical protein
MEFQSQHLGQQFDHQRFCNPRNSLDQSMAATQGDHQRLIDEGVLPGNDFAKFSPAVLEKLRGCLELNVV